MSNAIKTARKIKTQHGVDGAVAYDAKDAAQKASQQMVSIDTALSAGMINSDGTLSDAGKSATTIDALSKMMPMLNRAGVFKDAKAREKAVRAMAKSKLGANASEDKIQDFLEKEGWDNVDKMSGEEFAKDLFSRQGAVFASHAQIAGKDGTMYTLAFGKGGATAQSKSGTSGVNDDTFVDKKGRKTVIDSSTTITDATKISTGMQLQGTTLDPTAWTEVSAKMARTNGTEAVKGAIADVKNGNFDNFRRMAENTFGKKGGDEVTQALKAQFESESGSDYLGEALFAGATTIAAYKADKKFNDGKFLRSVVGNSNPVSESKKQTNNDQPYKTDGKKTDDIHINSSSDIDEHYNEKATKVQNKIDDLDWQNDRDNKVIKRNDKKIEKLKKQKSLTYNDKDREAIESKI